MCTSRLRLSLICLFTKCFRLNTRFTRCKIVTLRLFHKYIQFISFFFVRIGIQLFFVDSIEFYGLLFCVICFIRCQFAVLFLYSLAWYGWMCFTSGRIKWNWNVTVHNTVQLYKTSRQNLALRLVWLKFCSHRSLVLVSVSTYTRKNHD